jgi:aspartyl-tRNA(Asn)/glutamyl-tRNA(Gln) amidotransferase subunit B
MEDGALRVDVNVSVVPDTQKNLGVKTEVKNLNSIRSVSRCVELEIERQISTLCHGGRVFSETRHFDYDKKVTVSLRKKEKDYDYRYVSGYLY